MAGTKNKARVGKYQVETMIKMFRKAAAFRKEMLEAGFTDNGGAIHSAERILNILGMRLKYPGLNHINKLKEFRGAEFSIEAKKLHTGGGKVRIEHVAPLRHLTRMAIEVIEKGISDEKFKAFVERHYRLVLLSTTETELLNRHNRSTVSDDRLGAAGIKLTKRSRLIAASKCVSSAV